MNRRARVSFNGRRAGTLEKTAEGACRFAYDPLYLAHPGATPVSLTLPLRPEPYESGALFPFFAGLLAEGSLKEMQCRLFKIDPADDFTLLLKTTGDDVIGAVTVEEEAE